MTDSDQHNQPCPGEEQKPSKQSMGVGLPQDPEKIKLIQQQLVLILHAHKCQQRQKLEPQNCGICFHPYCSTMKSVLEHFVKCTSGRQCQFPHCVSSRQIISHWTNCNLEYCRVCTPVKKYTTQQDAGQKKTIDTMLNNLHI
ncbi:unnamed protein product [Meloidogyne enterolobii]|uniref:Uncharacterized protein n=1 Tax=Meloidogyne enterolobii TaxID=390850 RepID=A0ACB0YVQ5_MELEN